MHTYIHLYTHVQEQLQAESNAVRKCFGVQCFTQTYRVVSRTMNRGGGVEVVSFLIVKTEKDQARWNVETRKTKEHPSV